MAPQLAVPGRISLPPHLPITNISYWVEWFSLLAAVICSHFPEKALGNVHPSGDNSTGGAELHL